MPGGVSEPESLRAVAEDQTRREILAENPSQSAFVALASAVQLLQQSRIGDLGPNRRHRGGRYVAYRISRAPRQRNYRFRPFATVSSVSIQREATEGAST